MAGVANSGLPRLPAYVPPKQALTRATAREINRTSRATETTITLAGFGRVIPVIYGEERVPGIFLVSPRVYSGDFLCAILWGWGEIEGVQTLFINGATVPGGVTVTHYTGTDSQAPDPTLSAAISGFADAYPGLAYTVLRIPPSTITGFPQRSSVEAVVRGRKIIDPRIVPAPVSARYWRLLVTQTRTVDTFFTSIAEIELRAASGGPNQTGSGTPYASTDQSSTFDAAKAFDNDATTIWSSQTAEPGPQWIAYDFGSATTVAEVTIQSGDTSARASRAPRAFDIQYSNDGSTWTTARSHPDTPPWLPGEVRAFSSFPDGSVWTKNPGLFIYDWVTSERYGPSRYSPVSIAGIEAVADRCDELVGGVEPRCEAGITLSTPADLPSIMNLLSTYAECLWAYEGDGIIVVPDAPIVGDAPVISRDDIVDGTFRLTSQDLSFSPTEVTVRFRDSFGNANEWPEAVETQRLPGVDLGEEAAITSELDLPGVRRASEAIRKALGRLRRLQHPGSYSFQLFDVGAFFQKGDVVQLPDTRGLEGEKVRLLSKEMVGLGIYQFTAEKYDPANYPDDYDPGARVQLHVGAIIPFAGPEIPDGFERFEDADGRYIRGAGGSLSPGDTGGQSTVDGWAGLTADSGQHSGERALRLYGSPGSETSAFYDPINYPMPGSQFTPPFSGNHNHSITVPASGEVRPSGRQSIWIKKTGAAGFLPKDAEVLANGELISATMSAVSMHLGRLVSSGPSNASISSLSSAVSAEVDDTDATHVHAGRWHNRVLSGPPSGAYEYVYEYAPAGTVHDHDGAVTVIYSGVNARRRRLAAYLATTESEIIPGCIVGHDPLEPIPAGWYECDGTNGTVDLSGFFIERSSVSDAGSSAGNNTVNYSGATIIDDTHSHQGASHGYYMPHSTWWHGDPGGNGHSHGVGGSRPFVPPFYAMLFIQYTGVE